jgi:hypothetical protein
VRRMVEHPAFERMRPLDLINLSLTVGRLEGEPPPPLNVNLSEADQIERARGMLKARFPGQASK